MIGPRARIRACSFYYILTLAAGPGTNVDCLEFENNPDVLTAVIHYGRNERGI